MMNYAGTVYANTIPVNGTTSMTIGFDALQRMIQQAVEKAIAQKIQPKPEEEKKDVEIPEAAQINPEEEEEEVEDEEETYEEFRTKMFVMNDLVYIPKTKEHGFITGVGGKDPFLYLVEGTTESDWLGQINIEKPQQSIQEYLQHMIDDAKNYHLAAKFILHAPVDKFGDQIFTFFARRWWKDFQFQSEMEEDPKAKIWEVLLEKKIVSWPDLWHFKIPEDTSNNSLGLVVFFRGTEASRKKMQAIYNEDEKFKEMLQKYRVGHKNLSLFESACDNMLPAVLPYVHEIYGPVTQEQVSPVVQRMLVSTKPQPRKRACLMYFIDAVICKP